MIEEGKNKIDPSQIHSNAEQPPDKESAAGKQSMLNKFIGQTQFIFAEANLGNGEKEQGVTLDSAHRSGNQQLIFDTPTVDAAEMTSLTEFANLINQGGKDSLKGTKYEWFFAEENENFLQDLVRLIEYRKKELEEGKSQSSLRSQMGFDEKIVSAMESFREMAKRKKLKEAVDRQVEKVPITRFEAQTKDGNIVDLRFNPSDITDPSNEVEVLFVNNETGEKELIFSCKHPDKYTTIRPIIDATATDNPKTYGIVDGSFQNIRDVDDKGGKDYSRYEFEITKKAGQIEPLFTRIKVLKKPIDLNQELDAYLAEQKEREELERFMDQQQQARYAAQKPAVPSSSQYRWQQQPQTYSRSG